jgi:hypothetical protein
MNILVLINMVVIDEHFFSTETHPASYIMGTGGSFFGGKAAGE